MHEVTYPAPWVAEDAVVDLRAHLGRWVAIGPRATVGADAQVDDSVIMAGAVVEPGARVVGSILGLRVAGWCRSNGAAQRVRRRCESLHRARARGSEGGRRDHRRPRLTQPCGHRRADEAAQWRHRCGSQVSKSHGSVAEPTDRRRPTPHMRRSITSIVSIALALSLIGPSALAAGPGTHRARSDRRSLHRIADRCFRASVRPSAAVSPSTARGTGTVWACRSGVPTDSRCRAGGIARSWPTSTEARRCKPTRTR